MMRVPDEGYSTNTSWVLNYVVFQSLDDACTWWRLFHKHVVPTKSDIYVFITINIIYKFSYLDSRSFWKKYIHFLFTFDINSL